MDEERGRRVGREEKERGKDRGMDEWMCVDGWSVRQGGRVGGMG